MKSSLELGDLIRKSAKSKVFLYTAYVLGVLFASVSFFIYYGAIVPINEGTMRFSGEISILYFSIAFILGMALIILITAIFFTRGAIVYLYENAIVFDYKDRTETIFINDIQDVYLFKTGRIPFNLNNVAVRTSSDAQWHVVSVNYRGSYQVIEFLRSRHAAIFVSSDLENLEQGQKIDFTYCDFSIMVKKQFSAFRANSFLNIKTKTMHLYADKLVVGKETFYLEDIEKCSIHIWTNQIQLIDKNQQVVFSKGFSLVFSGDSFVALLNHLVKKKNNRN